MKALNKYGNVVHEWFPQLRVDLVITGDEAIVSLAKSSGEFVNYNISLQDLPNLESLGDLEFLASSLEIKGCPKLKTLGNIRTVAYNLKIKDAPNLHSLGYLEVVGRFLELGEGVYLSSITKLRVHILVAGFATVPPINLSAEYVRYPSWGGAYANGEIFCEMLGKVYNTSLLKLITLDLSCRSLTWYPLIRPVISARKKGLI